LYIGKADGTFALVTLTQGANMTITNGDGTITLAASGGGGASFWTALVATTDFSTTGASTSTITMVTDQTAIIPVNSPIRYTYNGVVYYGQVTALTSILMTIAGPTIGTGAGLLTALAWGDASHIEQVDIVVNGYYEDAANTALILSDLNTTLLWNNPKAYAVRYKVWSKVHDSGGTHGKATILINATELNTSADGLTIAANATWYSTVVDIAPAAYDINPGEAIELSVTKGTTGDAHDLAASIVFVYP
jgi:hypothetical protein